MREINLSLTKLQKQANDAELYKNYKDQEEEYKIKIISKKIMQFDELLNESHKKEKELLLKKTSMMLKKLDTTEK